MNFCRIYLRHLIGQGYDSVSLYRELLCRRGREKNRDFQPVSRFISETIQDMAIVIIEDESFMRSIE